ncbi:MAG: gliding motility-associated C-terminal domain-containing protein [Bacteroidota bacterium]|nr:gliding motility-associated C-terminal domain-containing protein [Bacteroidota bacterium]
MKKLFFILFFLIACLSAEARHVAGGELFYEYIGPGSAGYSNYKITLRLFRDCSSNGPLLENENVIVGIYENNIKLPADLPLLRIGPIQTISLNTAAFPCLVGNVSVCYQIAIYSSTITLPDNTSGYTLSRIGCCRIDYISNLAVPTSVGSNYVTFIPGKLALPAGHNSSPQFNVRDTALVCANKPFKLDFGAVDPDKDSLTFEFCDAYSSAGRNNNATPSDVLSLTPLPYTIPYSGSFPLGPNVNINYTTGIISGIAPPEGQYVVNVCITEWRNNKAISQHRKDFILKVQNCDIIQADLPAQIIQCRDSIVHFENQSTASGIQSYLWTFGDKGNHSSTSPIVDYPYADTGIYKATLTVTGPNGCIGSDTAEVRVYPGFKAAFAITGSCFLNPFQFTDATTSRYGTVNSWKWDFGDLTTKADTSLLQNPVYKYVSPSLKKIGLWVTDSKGCIDSSFQDLMVSDKPLVQLPFHDTLICSIDTLAIPVLNSGNFSWLPNKDILFPNSSRPLVFPKDTTRYVVTVNDNGCINRDTVTVNVLPFIRVKLGTDTLICRTDSVQLIPVSEALQYSWSSNTGIPINPVKYPKVAPLVNTQYYVTANLGKCEDKDTLQIKVAPYPVANAGPDTVICFGNRIQIRSNLVGSSISWSPTNTLINFNTANPIAGPTRTTAYIVKVSDTLGCTKTATDTLVVKVAPIVIANAGKDTVALPNQPIQLEATGGQRYVWSPEVFLSDPSIANPIATLDDLTDSIRYVVRAYDQYGCYGDDAVVIRIYKTGANILVPSAFTPNGDGKNDLLRPVLLGISRLQYFRVFNRWGQMVFSTQEEGKGWDGSFNGTKQPPGTYVYMAAGTDYQGKTQFRKGTAVLIR